MLIMICPCGEILGNKQLIYEKQMKEICNKFNIDYDAISSGKADNNEEYVSARQKIVKNLCRRYCCQMNLMNYIDIILLIKD